MTLGIKPTVDFAFKKIFGSPQNSTALIGLINAILDLEHPVDSVEVHPIELTKYNLDEGTVFQGGKLDKWAF